ncbi:MAG: hypothetical protein BWY66_00234 [bacterium ADurb.Bin374]|nr:MAG: hypothetical protein BWY66_00234 [bacterium ADurb.Bin374]
MLFFAVAFREPLGSVISMPMAVVRLMTAFPAASSQVTSDASAPASFLRVSRLLPRLTMLTSSAASSLPMPPFRAVRVIFLPFTFAGRIRVCEEPEVGLMMDFCSAYSRLSFDQPYSSCEIL